MSIGVKVDGIIDEIGAPSFFHCFFSNVSHHLEPAGWGTKYPALLNEFYQGKLSPERVQAALDEIVDVRTELSKIPPGKVIWDIEDLSLKPPWGDDISPDITDLGNYFVTSTGRDLFDLLEEAFQEAVKNNLPVEIE